MDSSRFDNMTRLFGAGANRRQVLRGLLGGAGALAVFGASGKLAGAAVCQTHGQPCEAGGCCENLECDTPVDGICVCAGSLVYCDAAQTCLDPATQCCSNADCEMDPCSSCVGNTCTPYADFCPATKKCYNIGTGGCCYDEDCGDEYCVDGSCAQCPPGDKYCEATQSCYSPSTGICCTSDDCGSCETCSGGACKAIRNCCVETSDCDPCRTCQNGTCVPYADYCPETKQCYNTMEGECCYDEECGNEACTDGHCCPPGYEFCSNGQYCYAERVGECCNGEECGEGRECTDRHCCPVGYDYCPTGDYCYTEREGECCTDDNCREGHHCIDKMCSACPDGKVWCEHTQSCYDPVTQCCADTDCGPCAYCSEEDNICYGACSQSQSCCHGECVEDEVGCCQPLRQTCGVLEVTSAGGATPGQYDCCDGLLCCFGQSTNVCGECCADSNCTAAPGGVCNNFQCDYPTCDGKWDPCDKDGDCCHGLICNGGVCKHPHHPHPKPHPKPPTPPAPKPTPGKPVSTLPATGSGKNANDSSAALGITLAAGAAALLGAKVLRKQADEATEDA